MPAKSTGKVSKPKRTVHIVLGTITFLVLTALGWFQYENYQLKKGLDRLQVPSDWVESSTERGGSRTCQDSCPYATRIYKTSVSPEVAIKTFSDIIQNSGFRLSNVRGCDISVREGAMCNVVGSKNGINISISLTNSHGDRSVQASILQKSYLFGYFEE